MANFFMISLGCAKNLVDSEIVLGAMERAGWNLTEEQNDAQILLINTCGFIQSAVEEAIEEILQLVTIKKKRPDVKIVVIGCLVQRYQAQLLAELPEVDLFVGTEGCKDIAEYINRLLTSDLESKLLLPDRFVMDSSLPRRITTPPFRAWLKITEGCDNRCSYCMIPSIRGNLRSRSVEDILTEARHLEKNGVKELSLIAQDLTAFGNDFGGRQAGLVPLMQRLLQGTAIPWFRLLYLYPSGVNETLLSMMADQPRIVPYLDIPMQHASDQILRAMNRRYSNEDLYRLIAAIRSYLPEVALRTTFLVGFPGETDRDILALEQFMRDVRLDHVGIFSYANEEGCPSEHFPHQCPEDEKDARRGHLLEVQSEISAQIQKKYVGRNEQVLIEGYSSETDLLLEGRTRFQAPEVDGCVYITEGEACPGDIVSVNITEAHVYDLVGGIV
jgi:ribosomal protein S12 methylthiotransferase